MGVRDNELLRRAGWPGGVNNVADETSVAPTELREAVNVDLSPTGKPSRRSGYVLRIAGSAHSLFATQSGFMLGVVGGTLKAYDPNLDGTTIVADVGAEPISYAEIAGTVFWSNGRVIRRVTGELADAPLWVDCPGQPQLATYATGGLTAGTYQVAITYLDADGRESGSSLAEMVTVTEGQGIQLTGIPPNSDAATVRIYCSGCNGDALYHVRDIPAGTTSWIIGNSRRGKLLETQFLEPLPAGSILRHQNGRLFVASGPYLRWSPPMLYGLHDPSSYIGYSGATITLAEPCGEADTAGFYVAAGKRTYYLAGPDPKSWRNQIAYPHGAVAGTGLQVPGTVLGIETSGLVPYWLAANGQFCVGLPGGRVLPLTDRRFVAPQDGERGATLLRRQGGLQQLITALLGGAVNTAAASDSAVATIRRNGVTVD